VVEIVAEKDESTYRAAIAKYALPADTTWMVGNSPKSDINPALAAGLHAVSFPTTTRGFWNTRKLPRLRHPSDCWWLIDSAT